MLDCIEKQNNIYTVNNMLATQSKNETCALDKSSSIILVQKGEKSITLKHGEKNISFVITLVNMGFPC